MAAHFDPTRQRYDAVFNKGRFMCASSKMDSANKYASQHFRARSKKNFHKAIKSTARAVDLSGELPAIADVSSVSFVELVGMLKRCGISNRGVHVVFKKKSCYLLPRIRDSDSDSDDGIHNSYDSGGPVPDGDGGGSGPGEAPKNDSTGSVTDADGGEIGPGEALKRVRRKKMYVLVYKFCWFVLWALLFLMLIVIVQKLKKPCKCLEPPVCPISERTDGVYMENVVNFVFHLPQLVYEVLKRAPEYGFVILLFLKCLYDILEMIINLCLSMEKLRSLKKD